MSGKFNHDRRHFLGLAATSIAAATLGVTGSAKAQSNTTKPANQPRMEAQQMMPATVHPIEGDLPSLGSATGWLNSPPLTASELRGKVVLVEFWTYTCINWLRTLPYVRAWARKYKDRGLVVIGVHSPEFAFEQNVDNVRRAANDLRVDFPIAIDSDHAIWRAFKNAYWPALYFVDALGRIRHHQFGEGEYERSERIIQQLLAEAGAGGIGHELVSVDPRGVEAAADVLPRVEPGAASLPEVVVRQRQRVAAEGRAAGAVIVAGPADAVVETDDVGPCGGQSEQS